MTSQNPVSVVRYIILAVVVLIAGIGGFIYWLFTGIGGLEDELTRIQAPGRQTIALEETGTYTVFWEYVGGEGARFPGKLEMRISKDNETSVPVFASKVNQTYNYGGRHGVSLLQFEIESPGDHRIVTELKSTESNETVTLTLSHGFMSSLLQIIFGGLAIVFGSILLAALLVVFAFLRRRKSKAEIPPGMAPPIG